MNRTLACAVGVFVLCVTGLAGSPPRFETTLPMMRDLAWPKGAPSDDRMALVAADLNDDGLDDLIELANGIVGVQLCLGDLEFGQATDVFVGGKAIAAGDMNDDGWPDLVVATGSDTCILVNDGTGGFGAPVFMGVAADAVYVDDFNLDSRLDVLLGSDSGPNGARLASRTGALAFVAALPVAGSGPVVIGRFHPLSAAPDIFVGGQYYTNNGGGGMIWLGSLSLGMPSAGADWDGDGDDDFITVTGSRVVIDENTGGSNIGAHRVRAWPGSDRVIVRPADMNNDGRVDLVVAEHDSDSAGQGVGWRARALLSGISSEIVLTRGVAFGGYSAMSVSVGRFDSDGLPDIAVASAGLVIDLAPSSRRVTAGRGISVQRGGGNAGLVGPQSMGFADRSLISSGVLADANGDGSLDIAANGAGASGGFRLNSGDGTFADQPIYSTNSSTLYGLQDRDDDGIQELVTHSGQRVVLDPFSPPTTTGFEGLFVPGIRIGSRSMVYAGAQLSGTGPRAAADLDADDDRDVVGVLNNGFATAPEREYRLAVVLEDGAADITLPEIVRPGVAPSMKLTDFTGDGVLDVVLLSRGVDTVGTAVQPTKSRGKRGRDRSAAGLGPAEPASGLAVYEIVELFANDGHGGLSPAGAMPVQAGSLSSAVRDSELLIADVTGDTLNDLVIVVGVKREIRVHQGLKSGFGPAQVFALPGDGELGDAELGDFDDDGDLDLIIIRTHDELSDLPLGVVVNDGTGAFTQLVEGPRVGIAAHLLRVGDLNQDGRDDVAAFSAIGSGVTVSLSLPAPAR